MPVTTSVSMTTTDSNLGSPLTGALAQNSNYTNSTSIYVTYADIAGSYQVVQGSVIIRATGTPVTSPFLIATSTSTVTSSAAGIITYNGSAGAYGWMVGNTTTSGTPTYGITAYESGSSIVSDLGITISGSPSSAPTGISFRYGTGFGVFITYLTSGDSSGFTCTARTYYYNGTVNTSQITIGNFNFNTQQNNFIDVNGAFWSGWIVQDDSYVIQQAWVGKLYGQINPAYSNSTSNTGNIHVTLITLVSFIIVSLFMF